MPEKQKLEMFVVYDHPSDYPDFFVLRRHFIVEGGGMFIDAAYTGISKDIEYLRNICRERGLVKIVRSREDDSVIVETWL